jgi:amino acid transporter
MAHSSRTPGDRITRALARNRLGVPSVVFFVLSAAIPLTFVAGVVTTGYAVTGVTGFPVAFIVVALLLALFAVGYVAMSRHITNAGAFYTYVTHGLGKPAGVAASWIALLAYTALQVGLYGLIHAALEPKLAEWFDLEVSWWVVALVAWALVAVLGVLRVDVNSKVLAVLLISEIVILLIFDIGDLANPAGDEVSFDTLAISNLFESGVGAILVLAVLGFVGFEACVVFSEEARNPRRTIKMATYSAIAIIGVVYVLSSWAMSVATGPDNIAATTQELGPGTIFVLAEENLGGTWADIGEILLVTSVFAGMIAFHNMWARYSFALGRERVLPARLGETSARTGAPVVGSLVQSGIGLAVIVYYAALDLDPVIQLFFYGGASGALGVIILIATTSFAVIAFFARNPSGENTWRRATAPILASVALTVVVVLAIVNFDTALGVEPDNNVRWIVPIAYGVAAVLGFLYGLFLKSRRPDVYATIGLGANAATGLGLRTDGATMPAASADDPTRRGETVG